MNKGVTCHKTENSFVMRFTKEVWLACSASENDLYSKGLKQNETSMRQQSNIVGSSKNKDKKLQKFKRSWSVNTPNVASHFVPNLTVGPVQEETCTRIFVDSLRHKVKRHKKSNVKKSIKPKRTSCQEYDMSTIEGIFANDSTIEYDSDKTVDFDFSTSENNSGGSANNSFTNDLATSSDQHIHNRIVLPSSSFENDCKSTNSILKSGLSPSFFKDKTTVCSHDITQIMNPVVQNIPQELSGVKSDLNQLDFMPSVSSAFNLNFCDSMPNNTVMTKNSHEIYSSFSYNNFTCLSSASEICENLNLLKGLSTSNCVDILDSSSTSLSTIDFYANQASPVTSPREAEMYVDSVEKNCVNEDKCSQVSLKDDIDVNCVGVPTLTHSAIECHNLFKDAEHCIQTPHSPSEQSNQNNLQMPVAHDTSLDSNFMFCTDLQSDLNQRIASKKPRYLHRRRKRRRRLNFVKQNKNPRLKSFSSPLSQKNNCNLNVSYEKEARESFEDVDTDTDTIPLELGHDFKETSSPKIPSDFDSELSRKTSCSNSNRDNNANSIDNSCIKAVDLRISSGHVEDHHNSSLNSDNAEILPILACLSLTTETHKEVRSVKETKLEIICDDSMDDLEIVDLEDIEVNDVVTVNYSDSDKLLEEDTQIFNIDNLTCLEVADKSDVTNSDDKKPFIKDTEEQKISDFVGGESDGDETGDSRLVIDLGDSVNTDCFKSSKELIKIEAEDEQNVSLNIKPQMEYLDNLTPFKKDDSKELIVLKESPPTRKWERPNIFENLTAKVNLSVNNENISVTSNFVVNSFAQKLVLELLADRDAIKFKTKNSFSIENIKKVIHKKCPKADTQKESHPVMTVSTSSFEGNEQIQSNTLIESSKKYEKEEANKTFEKGIGEENISFNRSQLKQSPKSVKSYDEPLVEAVKHIPPSISKTFIDNSSSSHVNCLKEISHKNTEPSARKSIKRFSSRFVRRNIHLAKKSVRNMSILKNRPRRILRSCGQKNATENLRVSEGQKDNQSKHQDRKSEEVPFWSEDVYSDISDSSLNYCNVSGIPYSTFNLRGESFPTLNSFGDFKQKNPMAGSLSQLGFESRVDIKSGSHLTPSFQPYVSIVPLPLESLTQLAMRTNLEYDQIRDDIFEGVDEPACLSTALTYSDIEKTSSNLEILDQVMASLPKKVEDNKLINPRNKSCTEGAEVALNVHKRRASFMEALNVLPSKADKRRSGKINKNGKKCVADEPGPDKPNKPVGRDYDKCPSETFTASKKKLGLSSPSNKGRANSKKFSLNIKKPSPLPSKSSSTENLLPRDNSNNFGSILSLFDRSSVMSLPKIKKLTDINSGKLQSQRSLESYGVLEKIEKVMEDDCLKKFNVQSNVSKAMFPPMFVNSQITSCSASSPKSMEASFACRPRVFQSDSKVPNRMTSFYGRKNFQNNSNLCGHQDRSSNVADMKVGVDLLWMKNNKSHDPLGLEDDDEEENHDTEKLQNTLDDTKAVSTSTSTCEFRICFVGSRSAGEEKHKKIELDEHHLLEKIQEELCDLEVIIKIQQKMVPEESSDISYIRNRYRHQNYENYNDSHRKPYWRKNWNYMTERPYNYKTFYPDFNMGSSSYNRYQNRGPRWYDFPKSYKDQSASELAIKKSHLLTSVSSFQSSNSKDFECQSKMAMEDDGPVESGHFRHYSAPYRKSWLQPYWRSYHRNYAWQSLRKYGQARYDGGYASQNESVISHDSDGNTSKEKTDEIFTGSDPHHDLRNYSQPKGEDNALDSQTNSFLGVSETHYANDSQGILALVRSKVTKHLERSLIQPENSHRIVEEVMKKLSAIGTHKTLTVKSRVDDDSEGECDDSDVELAADIDHTIEQYLRGARHCHITSQHHLRPPPPHL